MRLRDATFIVIRERVFVGGFFLLYNWNFFPKDFRRFKLKIPKLRIETIGDENFWVEKKSLAGSLKLARN